MTERMSESPAVGKVKDEFEQALMRVAVLVTEAAEGWRPLHEVEREVFREMLGLGLKALEAFAQQSGDGDLGATLVLDDGRTLRRLPEPRERPLRTIFGTLRLRRAVYGTRESQKIECVPLDERLQLPASEYSYTLQEWTQKLSVECSFARSRELLAELLEVDVPVDSLERINRTMADPVVSFLDQQGPPAPAAHDEIVVASADGKGVPMRAERGTKGPAPKKMALLGAVYSVAPYPRTPQEVVAALFREQDCKPDKQRPKPRDKRLRASLQRDDEGKMSPAFDEIFVWLDDEVDKRSGSDRPVVLMDGELDLWQAADEILGHHDPIEILDLLHVTPRLWEAAKILCSSEKERQQFVRCRVGRILEGEVSGVIKGLRRLASTRPLGNKNRKALRRIARYFENNAERMRYNDYLARGLPIATGVIEGACRHLVRDRLERTGMRWTRKGAQAMLDIRSVRLAKSWDEFVSYYIASETRSLHTHRNQLQQIPWPIPLAA